MTINEMASAIRNRVSDGLSGNISNQAYSLQQIKEEIDLERAFLTNKYATTSKLNTNFLYQTIDSLKLECRDLSSDCVLKSGEEVPSIIIPPLMSSFDGESIEFVGLVNKQERFMVYWSTGELENHKYRIKTRHMPYVWIDTTPDSTGNMTLYFFNLGKYNPLQYVSVRAIFEHPTRVEPLNPGFGDQEYPAPGHMQAAIIDSITEKHIRYYRQLNIPPLPNTQSDPVT